MQIKAITFDLWDTVINDDSDEPVRAERGLRSKRDERHHLVWKALNTVSTFSIEAVRSAYEEVNDQFNQVWHDDFITWTVEERVDKVLKKLNQALPKTVLQNTIDELERMEIVIPPEPVKGVHAALDELSENFPLAVVSDAIVTPGRNLRVWLENHDLLRFFKVFAFSDEVGKSKPHPDIFRSAASQLGVRLEEMVHIGDREHNDIQGAHAVGMQAILFTGTRNTDEQNTTAEANCNHYSELPCILNRLAGN